MKTIATALKDEIGHLRKEFRGEIIERGDTGYDDARAIYNGMIDKKPAIIVKCANVRDVITAVNFGRKNNLDVSIKGGGHNGAGLALVDDGLTIDLSNMKGIRIDPEKKTARVEAGCTLGDVDHATHAFGLALPGGVISTTGVSGLTLGGGIGYLTRKCGLTIDSLLEADVVLANGDYVTASEKNHSDLFWAIRGGGGNFGVVTSFKFNLHEISTVYGGPMFWPLEKASVVMRYYEKLMASSDNDLYGFFAFLIVPPAAPFPEHLHNKNVCGIVWCYTGDQSKAEEMFDPIRNFSPPLFEHVGPIPMPALNSLFDGLYPPGMQWYWRADFFDELTDEAIKEHIRVGSNIPTFHSTMHLYPVDGAAHDEKDTNTAWDKRNARWAQVVVGVSPDPSRKEEITDWCKSYYDALHPYSMGGAYVNFLMEEGQDRIKDTYGDNYARLTRIKTKYDPRNFFHINQNIEPV